MLLPTINVDLECKIPEEYTTILLLKYFVFDDTLIEGKQCSNSQVIFHLNVCVEL